MSHTSAAVMQNKHKPYNATLLINLPENFLWSTLDLFVWDDSWFEILLGLHIVDGGNGVGLTSSFELSILPQSHNLTLPAV